MSVVEGVEESADLTCGTAVYIFQMMVEHDNVFKGAFPMCSAKLYVRGCWGMEHVFEVSGSTTE